MKINIKNIIKKITKKDNSASILIVYKDFEKQEEIVEEFARTILDIPKAKPYKTHSDVFGIWPENIERKNIKIEQIHEFIRKTQLKPFLSKFKVGIIFSSEKMTEESQNALLKTLEEPPQNTFLILTSANRNKLIPTVLSRCQILEFVSGKNQTFNIKSIRRILKENVVQRFKIVEEIINQKDKSKVYEDINDLLENLLLYFRQRITKSYKDKNKSDKILEIIELIELTQNAVDKNVNLRLALENLFINLPLKGEDY